MRQRKAIAGPKTPVGGDAQGVERPGGRRGGGSAEATSPRMARASGVKESRGPRTDLSSSSSRPSSIAETGAGRCSAALFRGCPVPRLHRSAPIPLSRSPLGLGRLCGRVRQPLCRPLSRPGPDAARPAWRPDAATRMLSRRHPGGGCGLTPLIWHNPSPRAGRRGEPGPRATSGCGLLERSPVASAHRATMAGVARCRTGAANRDPSLPCAGAATPRHPACPAVRAPDELAGGAISRG